MKARQAKHSMESVKNVMSDKTVKNKAERDRWVVWTTHTGLDHPQCSEPHTIGPPMLCRPHTSYHHRTTHSTVDVGIIVITVIVFIRSTHPMWARERCRISPPCFLAECRKKWLVLFLLCFMLRLSPPPVCMQSKKNGELWYSKTISKFLLDRFVYSHPRSVSRDL